MHIGEWTCGIYIWCLCYLTYIVISRFICFSARINVFNFLHDGIKVHRVCVPLLTHLLMGWLHFLVIVNSAALNMEVQVSLREDLERIPGSGIAGKYDSSIFKVLFENPHWFSWWLCQFPLPLTEKRGSSIPTSPPSLLTYFSWW